MKRFVLIVSIASVGTMLAVYAYREWLRNLYSGLSADKIADMQLNNSLTFLCAAGIVLIVLGMVLFARSLANFNSQSRVPRMPVQHWQQEPEYIEGTYWEKDQPVQRAIQQPYRVTVPIMYENGVPYPSGIETRELVLHSVGEDQDGHEVQLDVPFKYLERFANCDTPARTDKQWSGKPTIFYECQRWFFAHGLLEDYGQTKVWRGRYPKDVRLKWLNQYIPEDQRQ